MKKGALISFIVSSILITMFLFYIDEGYYNFMWMAKPGNWIAFLIYVVPVFLGQALVYKMIPKKYHSLGITALSVFTGAIIGLLFVIYVIFSHL